MGGRWRVIEHAGSVGEFHALPIPDEVDAEVWPLRIDAPTLVLGSAQRSTPALEAEVALRGLNLAQRRSGGGAVLLDADSVMWLDVLIGRDNQLWDDDIGRSFSWLGAVWRSALQRLGVEASLHDGPLISTTWSREVCFAGLGPGELTVDGRKLVGISQRRTRAGARFQCAVVKRWNPERFADLFGATGLEEVAVGLDDLLQEVPEDRALLEAFLAALA